MKGNGDESGVWDFMSLGSSSNYSHVRIADREGFSERQTPGDESVDQYLKILSSLSKDGLTMLAGGANGAFSLKPPAVGNFSSVPSFSILSASGARERTTKIAGGGIFGLYRASVPKVSSQSSETSLPCGGKGKKVKDEFAVASSSVRGSNSIVGKTAEQPAETEIQSQSRDECLRMILKLGTRWPAWKGSLASQAPHGSARESGPDCEAVDRGYLSHKGVRGLSSETLPFGESSLKMLASRALEELARTPDRSGRVAGGMLAPKRTSQEAIETKAAEDAFKPSSKATGLLSAVSKQPIPPITKATTSLQMPDLNATPSGQRTAPLTIFYAGTVNVCENVPEDKARLIMLFAEKAGISPSAQRPAHSASCVPLLAGAPQVTAALSPTPPLETARPQEEHLRFSKSSSQQMQTETCSVLSYLAPSATHTEPSTPDQGPVEISNPLRMASAQGAAESNGISRPNALTAQRHQLTSDRPLPLPNARKNSLARFLDSRKRNRGTVTCSDGVAAKKQALGCSSVISPSVSTTTDDHKGSAQFSTRFCSQASKNFKDGSIVFYNKSADKTAESEMKNSVKDQD